MPSDVEKRCIESGDGDCSFVIREVILKEDEPLVTLRCNMEFESESLDHAQENFMDRILRVLDIMSLVTHAVFRFDRLHKIFDWSPNKTMRSGLIFLPDPPESLPNGVLNNEWIITANLLQHANIDSQLFGALRWFRLGILADTVEEQFQKFWFALELLAQHKKPNEKVHDSCPKCRGELYCENCDTYPMHRPYPRQAIESTWKVFAPNQREFFSIVNKVRNAILHGKPSNEIEEIAGAPLHELVDPLAKATWRGLICEVVAALPQDKRPTDLKISIANTFVKWNLSGTVHVSTVIPSGPNGTPDIELLTGISARFEVK